MNRLMIILLFCSCAMAANFNDNLLFGQSQPSAKDVKSNIHAAIERTDATSKLAHAQLLEKLKQGTIDVYFVGDSITRRWGATDYPHFLENWKSHFNGWNAANFAWGGDTTHNILWRLQNGELEGIHPKVVVLQAGTNNLPWQGPADEFVVEDVVTGITAIIDVIQSKTPESKILLTGLFPRPQNKAVQSTIVAINERLAGLADGDKVHFLTINDKLADADGNLHQGFSRDGLHLELPAYDVWAAALKPLLTEILGEPVPNDSAPPATGDPSASRRAK